MKKTMIAIFTVLGLIVFSVPMAMATPTVTLSNGLGTTDGGEFIAVLDDGRIFETFCIETDEHLSFGIEYDYTLSDQAIKGGSNTDSGDPLSIGSAYLFRQFYLGTLVGYNNTVEDANALQHAFWMLEQEEDMNTGNEFIILAMNELGLSANQLLDDNNGAYAVQVMNLTIGTTDHQSLLYSVPDASVMLLLGPALLCLGMIGRRKSKRA